MKPFRSYLLEISEIEETPNFNVFGFTLRLMKSLRNKEITSTEFDGLSSELEFQCKRLGISTESKELNFSLF
jgi:hypothetical protein